MTILSAGDKDKCDVSTGLCIGFVGYAYREHVWAEEMRYVSTGNRTSHSTLCQYRTSHSNPSIRYVSTGHRIACSYLPRGQLTHGSNSVPIGTAHPKAKAETKEALYPHRTCQYPRSLSKRIAQSAVAVCTEGQSYVVEEASGAAAVW
eukprot:692747-Rhodomonas_salina.2